MPQSMQCLKAQLTTHHHANKGSKTSSQEIERMEPRSMPKH